MTDYSKSTTVLCTLTDNQVISVLIFFFRKGDDLTENCSLQRFLNLGVEKKILLMCIHLILVKISRIMYM